MLPLWKIFGSDLDLNFKNEWLNLYEDFPGGSLDTQNTWNICYNEKSNSWFWIEMNDYLLGKILFWCGSNMGITKNNGCCFVIFYTLFQQTLVCSGSFSVGFCKQSRRVLFYAWTSPFELNFFSACHQVFLSQYRTRGKWRYVNGSDNSNSGATSSFKASALLVIDTIFRAIRTSWAFPLLNIFGSSWIAFWHTPGCSNIWRGSCRYIDAYNNQVLMYGGQEFKSTRTSDPPAKRNWCEPRKSCGGPESKVTHPGRHMDNEIQLITLSNKSSPP